MKFFKHSSRCRAGINGHYDAYEVVNDVMVKISFLIGGYQSRDRKKLYGESKYDVMLLFSTICH